MNENKSFRQDKKSTSYCNPQFLTILNEYELIGANTINTFSSKSSKATSHLMALPAPSFQFKFHKLANVFFSLMLS